MRILLLGSTGAEATFRAWSDWLSCAGVPFDAIAIDGQRAPVAIVDEAGDARYQGLILASGGLPRRPSMPRNELRSSGSSASSGSDG
jgi:hypothetical protein